MKLMIDTDTLEVSIVEEKKETSAETLASLMAKYRGAKEYEGIVETIQTWYYGYVPKIPWCATAVSYFANQLGILEQFGGRNDNVYTMKNDVKRTSPDRCFEDRRFLDEGELLPGDVLFFTWNGKPMTPGSSKHVGVCEHRSTSGTVFCIGGNQKDKICTLEYDRKCLEMVFRPIYG